MFPLRVKVTCSLEVSLSVEALNTTPKKKYLLCVTYSGPRPFGLAHRSTNELVIHRPKKTLNATIYKDMLTIIA